MKIHLSEAFDLHDCLSTQYEGLRVTVDCLFIIKFEPYIHFLRGMKHKLRKANKNVVFKLEKGNVMVRN